MKSNLQTAPLIRGAIKTDLDALVQLEGLCFDYSRIGRRSFQRLLQSNSAHIFVLLDKNAQSDAAITAYALLLTRKNSMRWRLYSIAVAPAARGKGYARMLLTHCIEVAQQQGASGLSLEVKSDNKSAIRLYEELDFAVVDLLSGYYDDGTDGYRMRLSFPAANP